MAQQETNNDVTLNPDSIFASKLWLELRRLTLVERLGPHIIRCVKDYHHLLLQDIYYLSDLKGTPASSLFQLSILPHVMVGLLSWADRTRYTPSAAFLANHLAFLLDMDPTAIAYLFLYHQLLLDDCSRVKEFGLMIDNDTGLIVLTPPGAPP